MECNQCVRVFTTISEAFNSPLDTPSVLERAAQTLTEQSDADLDRLAQFAAAYSQRSADMLYRIFVKYQRFR